MTDRFYGDGSLEVPENMEFLAGVHEDGHVAEIDDVEIRRRAKAYIANGNAFAEFQMFLAGPLDLGLGEGRLADPEIKKWVLDGLARIWAYGYESAVRGTEGSRASIQELTWGSAQAFLPGGDPALLVVRNPADQVMFDADDPDGRAAALSEYIEHNRGQGEQ